MMNFAKGKTKMHWPAGWLEVQTATDCKHLHEMIIRRGKVSVDAEISHQVFQSTHVLGAEANQLQRVEKDEGCNHSYFKL